MSSCRVMIEHLRHEGGTKDYLIIGLHLEGRAKAHIFKAYGPIGKTHQLTFEATSPSELTGQVRAIAGRKAKRGYKTFDEVNDYFFGAEAILDLMGRRLPRKVLDKLLADLKFQAILTSSKTQRCEGNTPLADVNREYEQSKAYEGQWGAYS